jgi:polar amino acid transport system substrate-binding protein
MNRRDAISIGAILLLSRATALKAQGSAAVEAFVKAGKIRAAFAVAPILATKDPATGEMRGVAIDLAQEIGSRIGVRIQPVVYPRPGAVMEGLRSDAWDIAFLGIDPSRSAEADFTPAYMEVDLTYLVRGNSDIQKIPDADKPGVRIAVPRNDLVDILLGRVLKQAQLVRADTVAGAFDLLRSGQADVCAEPRPNLVEDQEYLPGSRVLSDRFGVNRVGIVVPKGKVGQLAYFTQFVDEAKASGLVQRAIDHAGLRGVQVAPRTT